MDKIPTVHLGHYAHQLEKRGIKTDRGDINREIERANREIAEINRELALLQREHEQEAALKQISAPLEPSGVLSRFPEDSIKPLDLKPDGRENRENKDPAGGADPVRLTEETVSPSPQQPEHHVRLSHERPARGTERQEDTKPPPLPHRHPVGRTWAQHRHAALEQGQQREAAERGQPPPLRRHFESRSPAQQHRTPQEPERTETPEPSGENLSHHSRIENNHMRRMVSPEAETLAKQQKTESDKLPEKEQDHVRPTSPGGGRKLGFRDLRETLKKEHEQEKEEELDRSSRDRPDRKR